MDPCLLCLQRNNGMKGGINVASEEWLGKQVKNIIEQHFWPMKTLTPTSLLCLNCWQTVKEFHNFYESIKDAHIIFSSTTLKTEASDINEKEDDREFLDNDEITFNYELMQTELEMPIDENLNSKKEFLFINKQTDKEQNIMIPDNELPPAVKKKQKDPLLKIPKASLVCSRTISKRAAKEKRLKNKKQNTINERKKEVPKERTDSEHSNSCEIFSEDVQESNSEMALNTRLHNDEQNKFVSENFTVQCGICRCPMDTFLDVCKHSAQKHEQRGFVVCCNKKFFRRNILVEHLNWHINPEYFKCKDCGKVLADRRCLEVHGRVHEELEKTHICDKCGKGFARRMALERHKLSHLPQEERKFSCKHCPKKFGNNDLLVEHTRSAHLTKLALICYICGKGMRTKAVYKRHMQQHEGVPPTIFSCDICGRKMTDIHRLKTHKTTKHPEDGHKEYNCHLCPKVSPSPKALKAHVRYKHELSPDFKCAICDKAFKRALSLKEHMATHTGTELYTCPHCPKTFKSNANMHGHRKKAHPEKWEESHREKYSGNLPENFRVTS